MPPRLALLLAALSLAAAQAVAGPAAPASLAVAPSPASGLVTLAWDPVPGATGYAVRRAAALTGPFATLAANQTATTYDDATGTPGVFAYYLVVALDATGESPASHGVWAAPALIVDNVAPGGSAPGVSYTGAWSTSGVAGSHGVASVFAPAVAGSTPTATYAFTPVLPAAGRYDIYLRWTASANRATNTPVDLLAPDADRSLTVNQTANGGAWNPLGTLPCEAGSTASVVIRNNRANNNVVADAVQFVPRHAPLAPASARPQDYTVAVFDDPFDGTALDPALWRQFIDRRHFIVSGGKLRLRLAWSGPVPLAQATSAQIGSELNWEEGGVISVHSQKFGYHEARLRIPPPSARGVDTAYWHMPADEVLNGYEIDAPEFFNTDSDGTGNTFGFGVWDHFLPTRQTPGLLDGRTWDYTANNATLGDPSAAYVTIGLEWRTDNTQTIYVNGVKLHDVPASGMNDVESILPSSAILSTKVLDWMNPSAGLDGAEALWDYARYYQKPGWLGAVSSDWTDPANWGPDGVPGPGRAAVFNLPTPNPVVTLPADPALRSLQSLSLDGAALPALTFAGPHALRLGASPDPTATHGGILLNSAVAASQTVAAPVVGVQHLQFANLSRAPGVVLRLDGQISGDGLAPRDVDFVSSAAANPALGVILLGQPLGPGLRHVNRAGDTAFTLPAGSQHTGELRLARGPLVLPDLSALGLGPSAAIVFKPNYKHSDAYRPRLRYQGPAATLSRPIFLSGWQADAVLEAEGSGPLLVNGPFTLRPASEDPKKTLTRDLRLTLSAPSAASGENVLASALSDLGLVVDYLNRDDSPNTGPATLTLNKTGPGAWVLAGENHLAEPVSVSGGRLVIGQGTSGSLTLRTSPRTGASPAVAVSTGAELVFARDDDVAFSSPVTGGGALRKRGAGTLTLAGAHTFSGGVTVESGALRLDGSLGGIFTTNVTVGAALSGSGSSAGAAAIDGTLVVSPLTFERALTLRATSTLRAAFAANASPSAAPVASSSIALNSGAKVDVVLNAPGSTADLRHVFWRSARVFPLLSAGSRSGTLALGAVSADSAGNAVSAFGAFSLQHTATGVNLLWTPIPGYPSYDFVSLDLVSPAAPVVSLPDASHALRLLALVGGSPDTLAWTRLSGPGTATFGNPTAPDTTVAFSAPGTHVLRLAASNLLGAVTREFTVHVAPPTSLALREAAAPSSLHPAAFIRSDNRAWNSGARDQLLVGRNNAAFRSLLAFDLSALPLGATLTAADLELWAAATGLGASVGPLDLHRLLVPFTEGSGDGVSASNGSGTGADWTNRAPATPWSSAGASAAEDRDPVPLQSHPALNPTAADIAGTRLAFASTPALVAAVNAARDSGAPLRLLLKATTDTSGANGFVRIASDDHADAALRPRLTLSLGHAFAPTISPGPAPSVIAGQPSTFAGSVTNASSSLWVLVSGAAAPVFADAAAPTTSVTFPAAGNHVLRLSAANAHGESSRLLAVTVLPRIAAWRQTHFATTADAGQAADAADPDADGLVNLLEYALASDPRAPSPPPNVRITNIGGDRLALEFTRLADPALTYAVEASANLADWTAIWTSTGAQNIAGPVTVADSVPVSTAPRRFLRLRVSVPAGQ